MALSPASPALLLFHMLYQATRNHVLKCQMLPHLSHKQVSVGCYCIVEDTKMSRWSSTGPLEAVKKFMAGPHGGNFQIVSVAKYYFVLPSKGQKASWGMGEARAV